MMPFAHGKVPSSATLRRFELFGMEADVGAAELIYLWARACGVNVEDISPAIADYLTHLGERNSGWDDEWAGHGLALAGCR
jgi:hypothetical protein